MSEPMLSWFKRRRESNVMKWAREHLKKVVDTLQELDNALGAIASGNEKEMEASLERLSMNEKAADKLEVMLFETLSRGEMEPKERQDMLRLVRGMDEIADWTKAAGRSLDIIVNTRIIVPPGVFESVKKIAMTAAECSRALGRSLNALGVDDDEVLSQRSRVEKLEHEIDDLYFEAKKDIVKRVEQGRGVLLLNDLLTAIENASDTCKEAADMLFILVSGTK